MKNLLPVLLLLFTNVCSAQNYNCVRVAQPSFYINETGYLRGLRIDSVRVSGADTLYYPQKTVHDIYSVPPVDDKGSWLGSLITKHPDGSFLFNTIWGHNVLINTQAEPGDTWTFLNDGSPRNYKATMTAADTMTVLGVLDSVKFIRISAYTDTTLNPSDFIHNFEIIISKEHGLVKAFNFFLFPYRMPGSETLFNDFYEQQAGGYSTPGRCAFSLVEFHIPSAMEVYDFNAGDVFITTTTTERAFPEYNVFTYDSIVAKTILDPWHVSYDVYTNRRTVQTYNPWGGPAHVNVYHTIGMTNISADTSKLFAMRDMPEDPIDPFAIYIYRPFDTSYCFTSQYYKKNNVVLFEGGPDVYEYKTGFEMLYANTHTPPYNTDIGSHSTETITLVFSVKNGMPCGPRHYPAAVEDLSVSTQPSVYPNPANGSLHISSGKSHSTISIADLTGRQVYSRMDCAPETTVDISSLLPGIYIARVNDSILRFVKQ